MTQTRIMIVDDSAAIRGIVRKIIESDQTLQVVAAASNGEMAVSSYKREQPDIVVMDVEMPVMNGLEALEAIIAFDSKARVLMCSTLTSKNADTTLEALRIGALEYIQKPSSSTELYTVDDFKNNLLRLIHSLKPQPKAVSTKTNVQANAVPLVGGFPVDKSFSLKPKPPLHWKPKILAVGSSTGGPQALFKFLSDVKLLNIPIVITQHMPEAFTSTFAKQITMQTGLACVEAEDNVKVEAGTAILAKGGKHMTFKKSADGSLSVKLDDGPAENFCKPAVDVMLRSLKDNSGSNILTVILTGMGSDGVKGMTYLADGNDNYCIAQNQETSVVWGMPGAVAKAGLCCAVLPLTDIGQWISNNVNIGLRKG